MYVLGLVFLVPHLNPTPKYDLETYRHHLSQSKLLETLPNILTGLTYTSRPGATHPHLVPLVSDSLDYSYYLIYDTLIHLQAPEQPPKPSLQLSVHTKALLYTATRV